MTITPIAPTVTPCPVDWCPCNGHHKWGDGDRVHRLSTLDFIGEGAPASEVAVECDEFRDGKQQTLVLLFGRYSQLLNRDEADQMVDAIRQAADLAFGPAEGLSIPATPGELPASGKQGSALVRTPAEQAVLFAVKEMANGRVGQNAVIDAWDQLQVARTLSGDANEMGTDQRVPLSTIDREKADIDEFDAATAELVERAGKPSDVNRLVGAAIRFRRAYLGA